MVTSKFMSSSFPLGNEMLQVSGRFNSVISASRVLKRVKAIFIKGFKRMKKVKSKYIKEPENILEQQVTKKTWI